jgi:hypothetical protein
MGYRRFRRWSELILISLDVCNFSLCNFLEDVLSVFGILYLWKARSIGPCGWTFCHFPYDSLSGEYGGGGRLCCSRVQQCVERTRVDVIFLSAVRSLLINAGYTRASPKKYVNRPFHLVKVPSPHAMDFRSVRPPSNSMPFSGGRQKVLSLELSHAFESTLQGCDPSVRSKASNEILWGTSSVRKFERGSDERK